MGVAWKKYDGKDGGRKAGITTAAQRHRGWRRRGETGPDRECDDVALVGHKRGRGPSAAATTSSGAFGRNDNFVDPAAKLDRG